jgi:uncharacterized protein involved in response to NO
METRGERMLALRHARMEASPAFLRGAFRPFFFGGALWAIIAVAIWLLALSAQLTIPSAFGALAWHRHEMLFGFVGAVIAGFLLTAIPNWTGRLPIAGPPLAALFALWVLGRLIVLFSAAATPAVAAIVDSGFYILLATVAGREVLQAKNRNVPIVGLVLLFGIANLLDHLSAGGEIADSEVAWKFAVALVTIMISLIGGRLVPSFTRNWLAKHGVREGLPVQPTRFDLAVIALTALAFVAWLAVPAGSLSGVLFAIAAVGQAIRLGRWKGWMVVRDPLVLILHVGYAWLPIGIGLLSAAQLGTTIPQSAGVHALTTGAMATMILAVMTRASLGHTGRELKASAATALCYTLISLGALLRVTSAIGWVDYQVGMDVAGAAWIGAFLVFLGAYAPILFGRRVNETR